MKWTFQIGILSFALFYFSSCSNPNRSTSAQNKSVKHFIDSIETSYPKAKKDYYSNGALKTIIAYTRRNNITYSIGIEMYKNGNINKILNFKNGKREGLTKFFYPNGEMKSIDRYLNGYKIGSAYFFYENGKLKAYNCFDLAGSDFYVMLFDSTGNKLKDIGSIISENIAVRLDTVINGEKVFKFELFVASPPHYRVLVEIGQYSIEKGIFQLKSHDIDDNSLLINLTTDKTNRSKLIAIGHLLNDETGKEIKSDTMIYNVLN